MRLVPANRGKNKRELTIPRLELLAILIGIRAVNFVTKELRLKISEEYSGLIHNVCCRLGIFHGTEQNILAELLRYKMRNGMVNTMYVVGLYH